MIKKIMKSLEGKMNLEDAVLEEFKEELKDNNIERFNEGTNSKSKKDLTIIYDEEDEDIYGVYLSGYESSEISEIYNILKYGDTKVSYYIDFDLAIDIMLDIGLIEDIDMDYKEVIL